jgi:hypothetical protein
MTTGCMARKDALFLNSPFPSCGPLFKSKKLEQIEYGLWDCTANLESSI